MIAAHRSAIAPDLGRLDQPVVNGFICGYSIGRHDPLRGCLRQRMDAIAAQLRQICAAFYRELTQVLSLNPRAAACMQADCVLSALLAARSGEPAAANAWARETAADWLARLGIAGRSGYLAYQREGLPVIAVDRQVCCHHFRRRDGDYCSTCPKLDTAERIARGRRKRRGRLSPPRPGPRSRIMTDIASLAHVQQALSPLHVRAYFDEELFAREQETIFKQSAIYVGHERRARAGDWRRLPHEEGGRVLVRNAGGVELISNVCRHRQALILGGQTGAVTGPGSPPAT